VVGLINQLKIFVKTIQVGGRSQELEVRRVGWAAIESLIINL